MPKPAFYPKEYSLEFDLLPDWEVRGRFRPVTRFEQQQWANECERAKAPDVVLAVDTATRQMVADHLLSWNLKDPVSGASVEPNFENLGMMDPDAFDLLSEIVLKTTPLTGAARSAGENKSADAVQDERLKNSATVSG